MSEEKKGLLERIMDTFKEVGNKRTAQRHLKRVNRILTETLGDAEKRSERLVMDIEDAEEKLEEAYVKVNIEKSEHDVDAYAQDWLNDIENKEEELEALKDKLETEEGIKKAVKERLKKIK
jgi:chromosome segregation ATPase